MREPQRVGTDNSDGSTLLLYVSGHPRADIRKYSDMDALTNADTAVNQSTGLAPTAFPEAKSSQTGVSVKYVHDLSGSKSWYVLRASYGRARQVADYLIQVGTYVYMPQQEKDVLVGKRVKTIVTDLLPNFVFAYLTDDDARRLVSGSRELSSLPSPYAQSSGLRFDDSPEALKVSSIVSFYYNHCTTNQYGKNPPLTIADHQMRSFIIATSAPDASVIQLAGNDYVCKSDDQVEVIAGKFKGVTGRVIRASRQQRILIELTGFAIFATAYVPTAFIRKISS